VGEIDRRGAARERFEQAIADGRSATRARKLLAECLERKRVDLAELWR
jgi:hypothetical protein